MKEDIERLEEIINDPFYYFNQDFDLSAIQIKGKALEKLLQAYKQDEKIIEEMAECINNLGWSDLEENKDIIEYFRKECE